MKYMKRRLQEVVNIVSRDGQIDPGDADLVRDAYEQVAALDPEDEQTPARVSTLVRGMANVLDGADEMAHGDEARQYLVAIEPGLHWGAEDIGLNVNRLRDLADFIERLPEGQFDMNEWGDGTAVDAVAHVREFGEAQECGTPACIAGWAAVLYAGDAVEDAINNRVAAYGLPNTGAATLGLKKDAAKRPPWGPRTLADELFVPDIDLLAVTQYDAAMVLRHLADTGRVDWTIIDDYEEKVQTGDS